MKSFITAIFILCFGLSFAFAQELPEQPIKGTFKQPAKSKIKSKKNKLGLGDIEDLPSCRIPNPLQFRILSQAPAPLSGILNPGDLIKEDFLGECPTADCGLTEEQIKNMLDLLISAKGAKTYAEAYGKMLRHLMEKFNQTLPEAQQSMRELANDPSCLDKFKKNHPWPTDMFNPNYKEQILGNPELLGENSAEELFELYEKDLEIQKKKRQAEQPPVDQ